MLEIAECCMFKAFGQVGDPRRIFSNLFTRFGLGFFNLDIDGLNLLRDLCLNFGKLAVDFGDAFFKSIRYLGNRADTR